MYNFIFCLNLISLTTSFKIKTSVNIFETGKESYRPGEVFDFEEEAFQTFIKESVPLKELSEKEAEAVKFPTDEAFVTRNAYNFNLFDKSSECYNHVGDFLYNGSDFDNALQNPHNIYHWYEDSNDEGVVSGCLPFIGKRNDVHYAYWNALKSNYTILTPAHSDRSSNFMWCKAGIKHVFLWAPKDHGNLYIEKWDEPLSGLYRRPPFRLEDVDLGKYPKYKDATRYHVKLGPHDVLHMPYTWIHHVITPPGSFCTNMWYNDKIINKPYEKVDESSLTATFSYFPSRSVNDRTEPNKVEKLWWEEDIIAMRIALANNQVVKIPNAFPNPERFSLEEQEWTTKKGFDQDQHEWFERQVCENCTGAFFQEIKKRQKLFQNILMNPVRIENFSGTRYTEGNYLDSHDDDTEDRVLTIVYHNTKDWDPKCRGEFVWQGGNGGQRELPSYNTLYLFLPRTKLSEHSIDKVRCGERFAISGWLYADDVSSEYLTMLHNFRWQLENRPGDIWDISSGTDGPKSIPTTLEEVRGWYEGYEEEELEQEFLDEL